MAKIVTDNSTSRKQYSSPIQRALKNFGKLMRGRGVAAILELFTIVLLARTLSPDQLGYIVLIQAYALIMRGLLNFKLYEVLVRFGVPLLEAGDQRSFKQLLRLTLFIDFSSCTAAMIIAVIAAPLTAKILGWDEGLAWMTMMYCSILLTYGFGTAQGVLRIFDRYDVLSIQLMVGPVLRLLGVLLIMTLAPSLWLFVMVLALATAMGNVYLMVRGWAELRRQVGGVAIAGPSLKGWRQEFPGLRHFIIILYWQGNVDMLPRGISTMLAGLLLGPAGAGFLQLARETTKVLSKPGALLQQVLFPDLVRMWVRRSPDFRFLLVRVILMSVAFGLVLTIASIFSGSRLFAIGLGPEYAQAGPLLTLLLLAATLELVATLLRAAGYAMDQAGKILRLHVISGVLHLAAFVLLTPYLGLIGAGIAACISGTVTLSGISLLVGSSIRKAGLDQSG